MTFYWGQWALVCQSKKCNYVKVFVLCLITTQIPRIENDVSFPIIACKPYLWPSRQMKQCWLFLGTNSNEFRIKEWHKFCLWKKTFENVLCLMSAILVRPQYVILLKKGVDCKDRCININVDDVMIIHGKSTLLLYMFHYVCVFVDL